MSNPQRYYPTDEDRALFHQLVATVRRDPARFSETGTALDAYYSPEAVRHRSYAHYEAEAVAFSGSIAKAETHPAIGPYREPDVSLAARFKCAWCDTFFFSKNGSGLPYFVLEHEPEDRRYCSALHLLAPNEQAEVAARRVLMAWLRLDTGRNEVMPRISEFQDLLTVLTPNGNPPLVVSEDEAERTKGRALYVAEDGSWRREDGGWFALGRQSFDVLERMPKHSFLSRADSILKRNTG